MNVLVFHGILRFIAHWYLKMTWWFGVAENNCYLCTRNRKWNRFYEDISRSEAMVGQILFPNRSDSSALLHSMLHSFVCADGSAYLGGDEGRVVVRVVWHGKNIPIWWTYNSGCWGSETIEGDVQEIVSLGCMLMCDNSANRQKRVFAKITWYDLWCISGSGSCFINA